MMKLFMQLLPAVIFIHITFVNCEKIPPQCKSAIHKISLLLGDINNCFILNSLTANTCISCVKKYNELLKYRNDLTLNETKCIKIYAKMDKYQTIDGLIENITVAWNGLNCDKCFNTNSPLNYSNGKMADFFKRYDRFMNCLTNYTDTERDVCTVLELDYATNTTNSTVCKICKSKYQHMYKSYLDIKMSDRSMSVCGDIENLLVCTKTIFETRFNCAHTPIDNLVVIANIWPIVIVLGFSMLFYSCTKLGLRNQSHFEIYEQKRVTSVPAELYQSLHSNFTGGISGYNNNMSECEYDSHHDRFNGSVASSSNTEQRPSRSSSNVTISQLPTQNPVTYNYSTIHKNNRKRYVKEDIPIVVDVPIKIYDTFTYQFDGNYK